MAHRQTGELKKRAWLAKQRLKMGYWDSAKREKQLAIESADSVAAVEYARAKLRREVTQSSDELEKHDEKLYRKVCSILDRDEATINPIGQLIDTELYDTLDPASKQRYVLELSNKFRELKERYYREKTGT